MKCDKRSKLAQNTHGGSPGKSISTDSGHSDSSAVVSAGRFSGWAILAALVLILLAAVAAYHNSLAGPFIFDDASWIKENSSIRHLWPIWPVLFPSHATLVGGRPVVSLTLAINYALGGLNVWGYHALNLAIHILAAWTLLGVIRRTLLLPRLRERFGSVATPLALAAVILWMVHPLQTESVTYIIQRTEALMGLLYLLTLYCFIRGASVAGSGVRGQGSGPGSHPSSFILPPVAWYVGSVTACLLGMATKEVTATAPVIILLYDRTFLAGSFREAWRQRYGFYLALAATWGVVPLLLISTGFYGGTTGFAVEKFSWWSYLLTQPGVIVHYLGLTFWPSGLCLDYGWPAAHSLNAILLPGILVSALLALTIWALVRGQEWGFLGVWFFVILAPSSSFVPINEAAFEHRMYLPLAAVATGVVVGGWVAGQWLVRRGIVPLLVLETTGGLLVMFASIAFGFLTFQRNVDYQSELFIWQDTVAKAPENARAHYNFGNCLAWRGELDQAISHYQKALEIKPDDADTHNNFGIALASRGQFDEAVAHFQKALEINPALAETHNNLGSALRDQGHIAEAIVSFQKAVELNPDLAKAQYNFGNGLAWRGELDQAICHFQKALEIKPDYTEARNHLDMARSQRERILKALAGRRESLRSRPNDVALLNDMAWTLATNPNASIRNGAEATELAQRAVQLSDGREAAVLGTLAAAYAEAGRFSEAVQTGARPWTSPRNRTTSHWQNRSGRKFRSMKREHRSAKFNNLLLPAQRDPNGASIPIVRSRGA